MSHAQELITAIQSCDPGRLRAVIAQLERLALDEAGQLDPVNKAWGRHNYLNDRLSGTLDLTALHIAAKAYSAHRYDARLASIFNEMVGDLLAAGASPWIELGCKTSEHISWGTTRRYGQTAIEVCERHIPPAMSEWIAENCDDNATQKANAPLLHSATIARRVAELAAWREQKAEREKADREGHKNRERQSSYSFGSLIAL